MNFEDLRNCKEWEFTKLIMKSLKRFFVPSSIDYLCIDFGKKCSRCICLARIYEALIKMKACNFKNVFLNITIAVKLSILVYCKYYLPSL